MMHSGLIGEVNTCTVSAAIWQALTVTVMELNMVLMSYTPEGLLLALAADQAQTAMLTMRCNRQVVWCLSLRLISCWSKMDAVGHLGQRPPEA